MRKIKRYPLIYRGIVVYNEDPLYKGRVKIYVPGIYPIEYKNQHKLLPWAEPAMNLEGGSWANEKAYRTPINSFNTVQNKEENDAINESISANTENNENNNSTTNSSTSSPQLNTETGYCSVPHAGKYATDGSQVYLFFEAGDQNKPIYFAAVQAGVGWFSEHQNQHVFHSDNVRFRIDEDSSRSESTCKFDTYNSNCVKLMNVETGTIPPAIMPIAPVPSDVNSPVNYRAKVDLEVFAPDGDEIAVNLKVTGKVNINIIGDIYLEHTGNKYETQVGDYYLHQVGNCFIQREGNTNIIETGNLLNQRIGNVEESLTGNRFTAEVGDFGKMREGNEIRLNNGTETQTTTKDVKRIYNQNYNNTVVGNLEKTVKGNMNNNVIGDTVETFTGSLTQTVSKVWKIFSTIVEWSTSLLTFK